MKRFVGELLQFLLCFDPHTAITRKSSYVTVGGMPPAALLFCLGGEGGTPVLARGYPSHSWGYPSSSQGCTPARAGGTPVTARGYPIHSRVPPERIWDQRPGKEPGTGNPLWTDRLAPVKILPSRRSTDAGGKNTAPLVCLNIFMFHFHFRRKLPTYLGSPSVIGFDVTLLVQCTLLKY